MSTRNMRMAICPVCRNWAYTKKDGTIGSHNFMKGQCPGYGQPFIGKVRQYTYYPPVR